MSAPLACPEIACWQALFDEDLPPEERASYERHLEACSVCQERLDQVEEGGDEFRCLVRQAAGKGAAATDPTLLQFIDQLHETPPLGRSPSLEAADLYFLQPSDRPDILGTLGAYEVEEVIGQGGMGVVLKAFEPSLHRPVAIKVMAAAVAGSAVARQRFTREAKAAAAVCHDHIVTVYGVHEEDGLPYLVMQYVAGESLQARLERTGALEAIEIVRIGLQTASGLAAAHAQGLVHRDIKPANLLLENGLSRVKITDFGLARMTDDVPLTQNGVVAGTPEYMAPEQARGETVDHRADLFSLGSVLYALCTGVSPFRGSSMLAVLRQVNDDTPPSLRSLNPKVPVWLEALIGQLMAKNPAERFSSAAEVATLLDGYLTHLRQPTISPPPLLPPTPTDSRPPIVKSRTWLLPRFGLMAFGLLAVLGLAVFLLGQNQSPSQQAPPEKPPPAAEVFQDFRNRQPLQAAWKLYGPDLDDALTSEDRGLRIKLQPTRTAHYPVGIATTFSLAGNFEITATYELLSASRPTQGYGVGVSLSVATDPQRRRFAKIGRFLRAKEGSVYAAEFWITKPLPEKDWQFHSEPTESSSGQLRLVREGSTVRFLVADSPKNQFHEIDRRELGKEDLALVNLEVVDSGSPGNTVDARLVDLRIRSGHFVSDEVSDPAQTPEPAPPAESRRWLVAAELLGLVVALLGVTALGVWLYLRQSARAEKALLPALVPDKLTNPAPAVTPISFTCTACGKKLKAKAELAGKKVKCSQCGLPVAVPGTKTPEAPGISS